MQRAFETTNLNCIAEAIQILNSGVEKTRFPCDNKNMKVVFFQIVIILVFGLTGSADKNPDLQTVEKVDLQRYMGKWYEIASFPQRFQKGCHCTTAVYELTDKNYVRVINTCRRDSPTGKVTQAKGKAFIVEGSNNSKLKVQFFWPFKGNYWIIDLAEDYSYAVVGDPSRNYLWILSRTPQMDPALYQDILSRAGEKGFDINRLKVTDQSCHLRPPE
jgi:apolipoprotein D and lipocalin family protein